MEDNRYARPFAVGLAILALGLLGGRTVWQTEAPLEPAPMEVILEEEALVTGVNGLEWDLPQASHERVDFWVDFLAGRNYDRTKLWLERSGRFAPFIRQELRARGMPEDLIYFAMIESGFSTRAYSRAHAVGIWQFIAETGRRYGLEVSPYVDERRDPVKATHAALDYLTYMYEDFGSWYLAAAGYNSGENRIRRILRERFDGARGDEGLYWEISEHLPRETRDYVPLMIAAAHIGKEPERYGFENIDYQAPLSYEEVSVQGGVSLEAIAAAAEAPADEVQELNPHLVRGVTPPGRDYSVRIPMGKVETFARNFERVREQPRFATALSTHTVRRGETLSHVAASHGVSVAAIRAANGGIDPRRLQAGQVLQVPVGPAVSAIASAAHATSTATTPSARQASTYRVRSGDTLWEIARKHDVSVRQLQSWNRLGGSRIQPGQTLRIGA